MNLKHLTRRMLSILGLQESPLNRQALMHGAIAARQVRTQARIGSLADVEFSIFSQWGEDGIIEWLVHNNSPMPTTFIEFGVENYTEANTRFLIQHRNWRGMVIDASHKHMEYLKADLIYWRHDLTAIEAFSSTATTSTPSSSPRAFPAKLAFSASISMATIIGCGKRSKA